MKHIALITDQRNSQLGDVLTQDLTEVLSGRVEIRNYGFDSLKPGERIEADVVLVTTESKALEAQNHVAEARRILIVHRTIRENDAYRIFNIPQGTEVLVVNNLPETTLQMVSLMQQLEFRHLKFVPFEEGVDYSHISIAITPGERNLVPAHISTIIDIGHRCIDISTFIEILNRLKIADRGIDQRLHEYARNNVNLDTGVNHQYKELFRRTLELDAVINLAHEGVLLLNDQGRVALYNHALGEMLNLRENVVGCEPGVLPPEIQEVLAQPVVEDLIVEIKGRSMVVNRKDVAQFGEPVGSYFNFQEVTYIRHLEQNLSRRLRERGLTARYTFDDVLNNSPRMAQCLELARRIAGSDFTVLIMGESGTGKELLAQSIHNASSRAMHPFVAVNCAAVPENLLESELFGYVGGSFTGALREGREGLFEQANNGSVFLDEIGDMPPMLQAKLLRVLQERQIMRVGSNKVTQVNIRVIAATNRNLRERIRKGLFREDLYYRLNALSLLVPPLRERPEDIFPLLTHFLAEQNLPDARFTPEARDVLTRYAWPGNIRELANVANHISLMADGPVTVQALPAHLLGRAEAFETESSVLGRRCGLERARAVLEVLDRLGAGGQGAGRRAIHEALAEAGSSLSEGEVRGALKVLGELELVRSRTGREGSALTEKGARYLNGVKNGLTGQPV